VCGEGGGGGGGGGLGEARNRNVYRFGLQRYNYEMYSNEVSRHLVSPQIKGYTHRSRRGVPVCTLL